MSYSCMRALAAIVMVAALLPCEPAISRELKLSHQWPESDARHRAARVILAELRRRAPDLEIKLYPNSALKIDAVGQYQALLDGRIDMAIYPPAYLVRDMPEFAIGGLPGIPSNVELAGVLKGTRFESLLQQLCEEKGFRFLTWWWLGGAIASRTVPVGGPESIKGLTVRGGGDHNVMLKAAGANVVAMPSSQLRSNMEEGKLDVVMTSLESFTSFRIPEQTKHATIGGMGIWTSFSPVIISKRVWDSLTVFEQEALEQASAASNIYFEQTQRETEEEAIAAFEKAGATVRSMTFDEYAGWLQVAKDTSWKQFRSVSPATQELFTSLLKSFVDSGRGNTGMSSRASGGP